MGTTNFLNACYSQIQNNRVKALEAGYSNPSRENWRWKRHLKLAANNTSPELKLERAIVRHCGENWSNQMPTASGLVGLAADKRAAIDLVNRDRQGGYAFIEIKVASDNPLFAAIEILQYGLLFVWSRNHQVELDYKVGQQPVLSATKVSLSVLAPPRFYEGFELGNLAQALNEGLSSFSERRDLELSFEFSQLGDGYQSGTPQGVASSVHDRRPIWV